MRVRAIKTGYHEVLRVPGTESAEFDWPDDMNLGSWMEKVEAQASLFSPLDHDGDGHPGGSSAPPPSELLTNLRARWKALTGKVAFSGWGPDKLAEKIAKKANDVAPEAQA